MNTLCDTAPGYGFSEEAEVITWTLIRAVVMDKAETGLLQLDCGANKTPAARFAATSQLKRNKPRDNLFDFDSEQARLLLSKFSSDFLARPLSRHVARQGIANRM